MSLTHPTLDARASDPPGIAILESVSDAVFAIDREWRFVYVNAAGEAVARRPRAELLGAVVWDAFPGALGTDYERVFRRVMESGTAERLEEWHVERLDLWTSVRVYPTPAGIIVTIRDITELKRAESRWRALIENASDPISILGADGSVRYGSPAFQRLLGYEPGALARTDALTLIHPADQAAAREAFARLLSVPDAVERMELRYRHASGCWLTLAITARNLLHDPAVGGIVCNSHDVTERRALEEDLRRSERRLRAMFEASPLPTYAWQRRGAAAAGDDDFVLVDYNAAAARATRGQIAGLVGSRLSVFYADAPAIADNIRAVSIASDRSISEEIDYVYRATGERRRLAITYVAAAPDLVLVHTEDFTERRRAEALFRGLAEQAIAGIYVFHEGRFVYVNPHLAAMLGYTAEEMLARPGWRWVVHESSWRDVARRSRRRLAGQHEPVSYTFRAVRKDGTVIDVEVHGTSIEYAGRSALLGTLLDVTERRRAEEALRESEERYRLVSLATNDVVWDRDLVASEVRWSDAVAPTFRYAPGEVAAALAWWSDRIHPEDAARVLEGLHRVIDGGESGWADEYRFRRGDGTYAIVFDRGYVARDAAGKPVRMIGAMIDLTEQRQLEAQLRQAQRMDAVGRLAGGIAHDFNNLLTVIKANTEFLLEDLDTTDPRREDVSEIGRSANRAVTLIRQLLAFSRQQVLVPRQLDLNATVGDMGRMLGRLIGEDIDLVLDLEDGLGHVMADPGQLEQVVVNLAVNARDAMPHGGRLTIATANVVLDEQYGQTHGAIQPGAYVLLRVSDTGHGMDRQTLERIFEPFFTTKSVGKGTGLGLATVYGIVKQSGGHVWAYSEPGRGTTFKIYLPRVGGTGTAEPSASLPESAGGSETLLLVEDEDSVRVIARRVLGRLGYTILEAANGREALALAARFGGRIDVLVTDIVMPELGGRDLAAALRRERPAVRVLYMSGYTDDDIIRRGMLEPGSMFLEKPFSAQSLGQAIRAVLDG